MEVLPLYDIETLYVVHEDMAERGITPEQLGVKVTAIDRARVSQLMNSQDKVLSF